MLNNFIYAKSKAMFEERIAEVPNDAIVFIEDTKEIWTHGTYFDCSTLDPNIIPNLQTEIDELKGIVDNKAYTDGSYPNMTVGTAKDLYTVQNSAEFEFSHKISEVESESDIAKIENIKGNSVVWNQLINNILSDTTYQKAWYTRRGVNYASVQNGEIELRFDSQSDAFGNSLRQQIDVRPGDKIYISYDYESHNVDEFGRRVYMAFTAGWSSKAVLSDGCLAKGGGVVGHAEGFSIVPSDNSIDTLCIYFCYINIASPDTTPLKIANFRFVNLTRMFGAGNEPTTIEEYHSRIPQGIDIDAYNEGEVIHMNVDAVKSVGFNQWDEKWENGIISESTGEDYDSGYAFRSKNVIRVLPNMPYYFKKPIGVVTYLMFYDDDMNFVQWLDPFATSGDGGVFTTPNAPYMRFVCYTETYNNDICINISDSEKNGIYEPYISRMQSLEILRKYFPNGMRSAGTAHDEIRYNKATQKWEAVKRIGEVDMGNQLWQRNSDGRFETSFSSARPSVSVTEVGGVLCRKYTAVSALDTYNGINGISIDNVSKIWVRDSAYTNAASFKAAMQGVILYYELATPIVTEIQETFNLDYEVWNGGTEQAVAYVKSAPFKGTIKYGIDSALAAIKNNSLEISNLKNRIISDGDEVSNLTLKPGCKIGSFSVDSSNNLSSHDSEHVVISNNAISISSDDYVEFTTIKNNRLQIVSENATEPAMYIEASNGIEIDSPSNLLMSYAIKANDGMFAGLRPYVRVIGTNSSNSDKTLTELDHTIFINSSSDITIYLPRNPKNGQEYTILLSLPTSTPVKHLISAGTGTTIFIPIDGTTLINSISVDAHGCVKLIYIKDIGWLYYRIA